MSRCTPRLRRPGPTARGGDITVRIANDLSERLAEMHRLDHVLLCSSGTYAVEAALRGLGVEADDEVILAGYDFPGNFRAVEGDWGTPSTGRHRPG